MKDRISQTLSEKFCRFTTQADPFILVDWKDITDENLKVHTELPVKHPVSGEIVKGVIVYNKQQCNTQIDAFAENALVYTKKRRSKQCECVVYPNDADTEEWILFIESKYANNESLAFNPHFGYPDYAICQIKETVQFFRDKNIIAQDKIVNAIISFPNLAEAFNAFVFRDNNSILDIFQNNRIIIRATNYVRIVSNLDLDLITDPMTP